MLTIQLTGLEKGYNEDYDGLHGLLRKRFQQTYYVTDLCAIPEQTIPRGISVNTSHSSNEETSNYMGWERIKVPR